MNQYNPYLNPYISPNMMQPNMATYPQQNVLPPQQILSCSGKTGIDSLKMSPNSSVLIADSQKPIIYKCVSDSLGNVSTESFDVTPHKDESVVEHENILGIVSDLRTRIERLENESFVIRNTAKPNNAEGNANEAAASNDEVHVES
jgi:hypothetical protein